MRAVILAGGQGARLRPYTTVLPKPLVPVGDRPILALIIDQLAAAGFKEVDLCVGYLGELIQTYFEQWPDRRKDFEMRYHWEERPLGTAGAVRNVPASEESLLVMNGDILSTIDYADLMRFHAEQGAAMTIACHKKEVQLALGVIEHDDHEVTGFVEKPLLDYDVSMGIYVYGPEAVELIHDERFDFPDLVHALLAAGRKVMTYNFDGPWFDIGTPDEYERASDFFAEEPGKFEPSRR